MNFDKYFKRQYNISMIGIEMAFLKLKGDPNGEVQPPSQPQAAQPQQPPQPQDTGIIQPQGNQTPAIPQ